MNWIKSHYDRALLILFSVLALLGGGYIVTWATSFASQFTEEEVIPGTKKDALPAALVDTAAKQLDGFAPWSRPKAGTHKTIGLFSSTPFVVMNDKPGEPFDMLADSAPKLREPIENWWLALNDLDYTAIDVRAQDPDKDGYTNLDEWNATDHTNPNSSLSKPGYDSKIYYAERLAEPLTIKLTSYDASANSVYIAFITKDAAGADIRKSETLAIGAPSRFGEGRFKVKGVKKETITKFNSPTLVDVAELEDTLSPGKPLRLEQGTALEHPSYKAKIVYALPGASKTYETKVGEYFELTNPPVSIQLKELHADHIVIEYPDPAGKTPGMQTKKISLSPPPK